MNFTTPQLNLQTKGAGVLPVAQDEKGQWYIFVYTKSIGKKKGCYVDFGGSLETVDNNDTRLCASREFREETFGIFFMAEPKTQVENIITKTQGDSDLIQQSLKNPISNSIEHMYSHLCNGIIPEQQVADINDLYTCFITQVPLIETYSINRIMHVLNTHKTCEWVPISTFISAFDNIDSSDSQLKTYPRLKDPRIRSLLYQKLA